MKIKHAVAVAFLVSLGFEKAGEWEAAKLEDRLRQVPDRVDEAKVPEEHKELFAQLVGLKASDEIQVLGCPPPVMKEEKPAPAKEGGSEKPAKEKPSPAKKSKKPAPTSEEPAPKPKSKKPAADKDEEDKDLVFGSSPTTIRARALGALGSEFSSLEDLVKKSGLAENQFRARMAAGISKGLVEARRVTLYRLKK